MKNKFDLRQFYFSHKLNNRKMKKLIVGLLSDGALEELKEMESDNKIRILNEEDMQRMTEKRDQIWKELEEYTLENIIRKMKEGVE